MQLPNYLLFANFSAVATMASSSKVSRLLFSENVKGFSLTFQVLNKNSTGYEQKFNRFWFHLAFKKGFSSVNK